MSRGGFRVGAGRPKGARTRAKEAAAKQQPTTTSPVTTEQPAPATPPRVAFKTAIEFAMSVINDPDADAADKVRLAIALMPFQAPKLAEKKADDGKGAKRSVSSKFAPPPPPGSKPHLAVSND